MEITATFFSFLKQTIVVRKHRKLKPTSTKNNGPLDLTLNSFIPF